MGLRNREKGEKAESRKAGLILFTPNVALQEKLRFPRKLRRNIRPWS
jgi:hypothetical protein